MKTTKKKYSMKTGKTSYGAMLLCRRGATYWENFTKGFALVMLLVFPLLMGLNGYTAITEGKYILFKILTFCYVGGALLIFGGYFLEKNAWRVRKAEGFQRLTLPQILLLAFTAAVTDPMEWLYPDSEVEKVNVFSETDVPADGTVDANILLNGLKPGEPVRLSASVAGGEWCEMLSVPVEYNSGHIYFVEKPGETNEFVVRRAPYRVYDALKPLAGAEFTPTSSVAGVRFAIDAKKLVFDAPVSVRSPPNSKTQMRIASPPSAPKAVSPALVKSPSTFAKRTLVAP